MGIRNFASQLLDEWAASERRKALAEQLKSVPDLKPKFTLLASPSDTRPIELAIPASKLNCYKFPDTDKTPTTLTINNPAPIAKPILEPDAEWRHKLVHPSVVLILGKRGSGKSALAYRLLELFRFGPKPYVVGLPANARSILPDWIGMVTCLEDLPHQSYRCYR